MATSGLSKSVSLRIVADAGTAKETLDDIAAKAGEIDGKKSSLTVKIDDGTTKADLDEITAKADALGIKNIRLKVSADTASADRKLAETKVEADSLDKSLTGAALGITGFGDMASVASGETSMFGKVLAGLNLATGVLEPAMAGLIAAAGGLASGFAAAGAGLGVFGLVAKSAFSQVTAADTANEKLTGGLGELQTSLKSVTSEYGKFVSQSADGVASVMSKGLGLVPGLFKDMAQFLQPVETGLDNVIGILGKDLNSSGFQSFVKMLADNAGPALEKISVFAINLAKGFGGIIKAFMPMAQGMLSGLDKISAKFATWGETLTSHSGFQSLISMFKTETPLAMKTLENLGKAIAGVVKAMTGMDGVGNSKALLQILTPLTGLIAKLADGNPIIDRTVLYVLALGDAGKKLKNVFTSLAGGVGVLKDVSGGVSNFAKGFNDADKAASDATGTWGTLGGKVSNLGETFKQAAVKLGLLRTATVEGTEAQEGLDVAMELNPIGLIVTGIVLLAGVIVLLTLKSKAFRDFWKDAWKDIKLAFDDVFGFIKSHWPLILGILTGPVGLAVALIATHWSAIKKDFDKLFSEIASHWPEIKAVLEAPIVDVVNFFEKVPGWIMGKVDRLPGDFRSLGKNIVIGLWDGILSFAGWLESKIEGLGHDVAGWFKSILGIFSPSTVFHGFGENIVKGLALGITDNVQVASAAVGHLGRSVSNSLRVSAPGGGTASASGTTNITNNITVPVSGLVGDAGATGRQIAVALNEYLRQTGQKQLVGA